MTNQTCALCHEPLSSSFDSVATRSGKHVCVTCVAWGVAERSIQSNVSAPLTAHLVRMLQQLSKMAALVKQGDVELDADELATLRAIVVRLEPGAG